MTDPAAGAGTLALSTQSDEQLLVSVRRALAADYDVEDELGRGGMAVVFKARDRELDRPVALKVLPPELAPVATVADRFKREARLAASLDHPNIIPVYRVGQASGVLYMAMKFIDGRPLDALIAERSPLPLAVVLTVLRAAARALAYAHEHGIVHRDIKGANILIDRDGRVVVSDFGIARAVESATLTATGVMIGTPHFMSPEQCAGKPVGPQSDQYSLGIVAYQLLTGSVPFDGDSLPEILQHHWFTPPPDASLSRPETPAALTATVRRMLAKEPAGRFASTQELVSALDAIPFSAVQRASGEAALQELVAPGTTASAQKGRGPGGESTPATAAAPAHQPSGPGHTVPLAPQSASDTADARRAPIASALRVTATPPTPTTPGGTTRTTVAGTTRTTAGGTTRTTADGTNAAPTRRTPRKSRGRRWQIAGLTVTLLVLIAGGGTAAVVRRRGSAGTLMLAASARPARLDPRQMRAAGGRAYDAGDYELARRFFVRAVNADPGDVQAQELLACALLKLGQTDSAKARFNLAGSRSASCR